MACCQKFSSLTLQRFYFCSFYSIFFLCHLRRKLEVCKRCRILLYIRIAWERVSIAKQQTYRCSIHLIVSNSRIICYCSKMSDLSFPFFPLIYINMPQFWKNPYERIFSHPVRFIAISKQKRPKRPFRNLWLQSRIYFFSVIQCITYVVVSVLDDDIKTSC